MFVLKKPMEAKAENPAAPLIAHAGPDVPAIPATVVAARGMADAQTAQTEPSAPTEHRVGYPPAAPGSQE
jgi:hypothetical protein